MGDFVFERLSIGKRLSLSAAAGALTDMEASRADRDENLSLADDLVDRVSAIKMKRANASSPRN